jgi:3-oxoacyl-[acyl-carrier-protein] synthase-1
MKPVLSALGLLNALGNNQAEVLTNLLAGHAPGMQRQFGWLPEHDAWVGSVNFMLPKVPTHLQSFDCRNNQLLLAALEQMSTDIADAIKKYGADRIGVVIGSSTSGIAEGEAALAKKNHHSDWPDKFHYRQQEIGSPAEFVARFLDLTGVAYTVSTACSSSAKALGSARQLLELDLCDAVICGGSDSLCKLTLNGFTALEAMSPDRCKPFAANRDGINIGEGAALFLMTKEPVGAPLAAPLIYFAGIGESADAHHISAPHPDGIGAEAAMRGALDDAHINAGDIHYINLHGTATPLNDAMESAAVSRVFGENTPCSSTKPLTGHTLGAAGATEAALCWLLLSKMNGHRTLPAQVNTETTDNSLATIRLLRTAEILPDINILRMLSNSFAFGGSNAAVVLETKVLEACT